MLPATTTAPTLAGLQSALDRLCDFVEQEQFAAVLSELYDNPPRERATFVLSILLDPEELQARGVHVPPDITIQRSSFEDGRPTLFCVTAYLPDRKRKVTVTFDQPPSGP